MARLLATSIIMRIDGVMATCGFAMCKDSEVCCCNATSGQSGFCVAEGSDVSVCTGSTMCPDGNSCCGKELEVEPFFGEVQAVGAQILEAGDICPGVGQDCKVVGSDGLACCGSEFGAGYAFCQSDPDYVCCSGASYAISCPSSSGCSVNDQGIPLCQKSLESEVQDTCPGVGQDCKVVGSDGLTCCGSEFGAGYAFCQTDPDYVCCSGASYAISCSSKVGCSVTDQGIPICQKAEELKVPKVGDFVCHGVNYNITCGPQYTACCGEGTIAPLCMDAAGHSCCKDEELNLAVTCEKGQKCNKGPQCTAAEAPETLKAGDTCPGVGQDCKVVGSDGLACCGSEFGAGYAFCQTDPDYVCCSGASYAISCSSKVGCSVTDQGIPICQKAEELETFKVGDFVCHGVNYNITCGPQYTACCGEGTIAPLCMDAAGHSCCKDDELNLAVTCEKGQKCNKGPQCTAASVMV